MRNDGNGTLFFSESKSPAWNWFHENYIVKPQSMKVTEEEKKFVSTLLESTVQNHSVRIGICYYSSTRLHLVRRSRFVKTLAQLPALLS